MNLRDELLFLRDAARRMVDLEKREHCFHLLRWGAPYDELFFGELSDPKWLPILTERGFYRCLPTPQITPDSTSPRYPWHLPLQPLPKIAAQAPEEVTRLLQSMHIPANPAVHDQTMRIIAAIKDRTCIDALLPILQQIFRSLSTSNWLWLGDIFGNWLKVEAVDPCFAAITIFLREALAANEEGKPPGDRWRLSEIDNQAIVPLANAHPFRVAMLLREMLTIWAESERARTFAAKKNNAEPFAPEQDPDFEFPPTYWLEDFRTGSLLDRNIEGVLAHRLYFIGELIFRAGNLEAISAFDELLRQDRWHLFTRLRWRLYATFPEHTLQWARHDVLARIPRMGTLGNPHGPEMAAMLVAQVATHQHSFLDAEEVDRFASTVFAVVTPDEDKRHQRYFQRRQLYPIHDLLTGESLDRYTELSAGQDDPSLESYQPFHLSTRSGVVEHRSPVVADDLASKSDAELWKLLNEWTPKPREERESFFIEETRSALGKEFALLAQASPGRFPASSKWWLNLRWPALMAAPLELATTRLKEAAEARDQAQAQPSIDEWLGWFGLAAQLAARSRGEGHAENDPESDWHWPQMLAVRFLNAISQTAAGQEHLPPTWPEEARDLLVQLVRAPDSRLDDQPSPRLSGWLSTAINSTRGTALEALLQLALFGKKNNLGAAFQTSIFSPISQQLDHPDASPAVFAIIGSNLRLTVHLFPEEIAAAPHRLLRPGKSEQKAALLAAHFAYDRPMAEIVAALPDLPAEALKLLEQFNAGEIPQKEGARDFGGRLGTHLGFYYWNGAFPHDSAAWVALNRFFELATPESRAAMIADIGRIFSGVTTSEANEALYQRVMELWDRRFSQIKNLLLLEMGSAADFRAELGEFFDWFECECFPFDWRASRLSKAIACLDQAPRAFTLFDTLKEFSAREERLDQVIEIFGALLAKPSNELRWSYQVPVLKALLESGYASPNPETRRVTLAAQESLLSQGLFEYLDIEPTMPAVETGGDAVERQDAAPRTK